MTEPTHPNPAPPAVSARDVSIELGGRAIWSEGTFDLPAGGVYAIIGPNGSGKTTLLRALLGLVPVASGELSVLGTHPSRGDARIGYVPQHYARSIAHAVRCRDLVALSSAGTRWGLRGREQDTWSVEAALRSVGAGGFADRRLSQLSGGQQQRAAIAQAIVGDPELVLLDEPLANLDLRNQQEIIELLDELRVDRDVTIIVVTHDLNPLLPILTGAVYLLDGHAHYGAIGDVVESELLTHLYGTGVQVVRTAQGDLFTRSIRR
ncbi:MAG: ATP-binding cassette domain-containing protein [Acidobacteria bacterium]|nr:ATP-binding cassette domain-containing protein [Acidobacteriota bacterium]